MHVRVRVTVAFLEEVQVQVATGMTRHSGPVEAGPTSNCAGCHGWLSEFEAGSMMMFAGDSTMMDLVTAQFPRPTSKFLTTGEPAPSASHTRRHCSSQFEPMYCV